MKIGIISGSHRINSQSRKVAEYFSKTLAANSKGCNPWICDLAAHNLPLWDEGVWTGAETWQTVWGPIARELAQCEGFVIVSPEWSGMVTPALKNFFLLASSRELGHKPGLIVTVSSGMGGSYPVSELRVSSFKNTRICYLPEHVIVRNVERVLNDVGEHDLTDEDRYIRGRIVNAASLLVEYSSALISVRQSGVIDYKTYPNGM